ncbi:MAG: response regulator transcription factor, partial [Roseiflexaceae bacterium]
MNDLRDKLVLVVDDEIRLTGLVRMNLESEGVRVITASNGREALDLIREEMPEVVILDVMMPGMDGFETLRRIRTASQVPVIMLTAKDEENDRIKGLELGADDYVGKPFSHRELISRVRAVLRRHYLPAPST